MGNKEKRSILIVDDSPDDIEIMRGILNGEYRVQAAMDSEITMKILRGVPPPDLVLLDIMMPKVDGYQLCRELKADESTKAVPVIFVTAKDSVEDEAAGFDAGCVDYIVKPVNPLLLQARVKTHIELKLAREDLKRQNDILRENARLREEVESIIRHDLKSPLMVILNLPGLLMKRCGEDANQRHYLQMIESAGRKMLDMINSSIDLYKMENDSYVARCVPVDVLRVIRQIVDSFLTAAKEKGVRIRVLSGGGEADEKEEVWIKGEELLFYTLCANLIKNAVEASPENEVVTVGLDVGPSVTLSIHNRGAIPESVRGRFFEKFATAGKENGTGLGAYSAKLIALTLGGTIGFETSEEKGTTISVSLPGN